MKSKYTSFINRQAVTFAAGIALTILAAASHAGADIVYSGPLTLAVPATSPGIYIDLATGATNTTAFTGWDINPYGPTNLNFFFNPTGTTNAGVLTTAGSISPYAVLALGTTIGASSPYGTGNSAARMANYRAGEVGGYLGLEFENTVTGALNYGWMQFTTTGTTGFPATITGYAFENTGASILAGQIAAVPEPGTMALLGAMAIGAFGLRQWRRRKLLVA